jgi:hypothetical protein
MRQDWNGYDKFCSEANERHVCLQKLRKKLKSQLTTEDVGATEATANLLTPVEGSDAFETLLRRKLERKLRKLKKCAGIIEKEEKALKKKRKKDKAKVEDVGETSKKKKKSDKKAGGRGESPTESLRAEALRTMSRASSARPPSPPEPEPTDYAYARMKHQDRAPSKCRSVVGAVIRPASVSGSVRDGDGFTRPRTPPAQDRFVLCTNAFMPNLFTDVCHVMIVIVMIVITIVVDRAAVAAAVVVAAAASIQILNHCPTDAVRWTVAK